MENVVKNNGFKILVFIFIILILIVINLSSSQNKVTTIQNSDEFSEVLKQDELVIIDVRSKDEYNESHIPKAINIPYNKLEDEIKYDKKINIVVYSGDDSRNHLASVVLKDMGYKNIYEGSISDYKGKLVTE